MPITRIELCAVSNVLLKQARASMSQHLNVAMMAGTSASPEAPGASVVQPLRKVATDTYEADNGLRIVMVKAAIAKRQVKLYFSLQGWYK